MKHLILVLTLFFAFGCNDTPKENKMGFVSNIAFTGGNVTQDNMVYDGATITSTVYLGANNVTFINCTFRAGIQVMKGLYGLRIYSSKAIGVNVLVDIQSLRYVSSPTNFAMHNMSIDNVTMDGGSLLLAGPGTPYAPSGWVDSFSISNLKYTGTKQAIIIQGTGLFRFNIHHNTILFSQYGSDIGDIGIFDIRTGSGQIHDNYRSRGWGWMVRAFVASIKGMPNDLVIFNNIDLNTQHYGAFEARVDDANKIAAGNGYLIGGNIRIYNNTVGNLREAFGAYSNAMGLIPALTAPYVSDIKNNVSFNIQTKGYQNSDLGGNIGTFLPTKPQPLSNNYLYNTYKDAGFSDDSTCTPIKGSQVIDAGVTTPYTWDFNTTKRPQGNSFDAGAIEYSISTPTPDPCKNCPCNPIHDTIKIPIHDTTIIRVTDTVKLKITGISLTYSDGSTQKLQ